MFPSKQRHLSTSLDDLGYPASDPPSHEMTPAIPATEAFSLLQKTSLLQKMSSAAVPSFPSHKPSSSFQNTASAAGPSSPFELPSSSSQNMASAAKLSSSSQVSRLKVFTANHDDGEDAKRFGFKAPTLAACLEIYMQDTMPDSVVGILLNLTPGEVEKLKSRIHKMVRFSVLPLDAANGLKSFERNFSRTNGPMSRKDFKSHTRLSNLVRSCYATSIGLEFPHLFREPTSHREFTHDWTENAYGCYSIVPWSFRRDILDRLIDICLEERDKERRASTSGPILHDKRPGHEEYNTSGKRSRTEAVVSGDLGRELLGLGVGDDRSAK